MKLHFNKFRGDPCLKRESETLASRKRRRNLGVTAKIETFLSQRMGNSKDHFLLKDHFKYAEYWSWILQPFTGNSVVSIFYEIISLDNRQTNFI